MLRPGMATLDWWVDGADAVALSTGQKDLAAAGSADVDLAGSQTVTLMARNACGASSAALQVAVGPPVMASASPGSASPGQLLTIHFDNLTDPSLIDTLVLTAPDGETRAVEVYNYTEDGTVYALAPYWLNVDVDRGYRTGSFLLSAQLSDGTSTGSIPLTITPLQYSGDAVAAFRNSLDALAATVQESFTGLTDQSMSSYVDVIKPLMAEQEAALRQVADSIAAGSTGTLYWGAPTTSDPNAVAVTVTMQDLVELAALEANTAASLQQLSTVPSLAKETESLRAASDQRDAGTCLRLKRPLVPLCKSVSIKKKAEAAATEMLSNMVTGSGAPTGTDAQIQAWVQKQLAKTAVGAALKKVQSWLTPLEATCLIAPIRLERFDVAPKFIPHASRESEATKVAISAFMSPEVDPDGIANYLEKAEAQSLAAQLKLKGVAASTAQKLIQAFLKAENYGLDQQLGKAIDALAHFPPHDSVQVGVCDLLAVFPKRNGPGTQTNPNAGVKHGTSRLQFATSYPFGVDDYYLMGIKPGGETLCIAPYVLNFLFHESVEKSKGSIIKSSCPYPNGLGTSRAAADPVPGPVYSDELSVDVGHKSADVYIGNAIVAEDATHTNQGMTPMARVGAPYVQTATDGLASASVDFRQTGPSTWTGNIMASMVSIPNSGGGQEPHQASAQLTVFLENPENRRQTQRIRIKVQNNGDSHCFFPTGLYAGSQRDGANGYGSSSYSVDAPGATNGNFTITADAMYQRPGESAVCTATVTVDLLDQ